MLGCRKECSGRFSLQEGSLTRDGKQTWNVVCSAGVQGGCKGPDLEQATALSREAGRSFGASARPRPLALDTELKPLTHTWRVPRFIRALYPSAGSLRRK